jgi:hypothetical protein
VQRVLVKCSADLEFFNNVKHFSCGLHGLLINLFVLIHAPYI